MVPVPAQLFVDRCKEQCLNCLRAIAMVGSFARGDQRPKSDIDFIVLVDSVDKRLLEQVGKVVTSIRTDNEINPALAAESELVQAPEVFDWLPIKHDGIFLFGQHPEILSCRMSELDLAKQIAKDVLMSSRHYIAVAEPKENFADGKLWFWNLKPLAFALRFYEYHLSGRYIRGLDELSKKYTVLKRDPAKEYPVILDECIDVCEKILEA